MNRIGVAVLSAVLIAGGTARAAEVILVGPGQSSNDVHAPYPVFSAEQRMHDLFDFGSYGEYGDDRSGMITGRVSTLLEYTNVAGNQSKSFYEDSELHYQTDLGLQVYEKLWSNYRLEGLADFRLTSLERVEKQEDVRLKQLNLSLLNPHNLFEFGNFYSDFSPFTMGSSLEGFNAEMNPQDSRFSYKAVVARLNEPEIGLNQRNVYGTHIGFSPFVGDDRAASDLEIGVQSVLTRDDNSSSVHEDIYAPAMNNWVASMDGNWRHRENGLFADWELAFSEYNQDRNSATVKQVNDAAFRVSPGWRYRDTFDVRYLYYRVGPDYFTATGSAVRDKEQHQINSNYRFNGNYTLSLTQNWYHDSLSGSDATKKTKNNETYLSLLARPFRMRETFSIRPYLKRLVRDSDDAANSSSARTYVYGASVNDILLEASLGAFIERRNYKDRSGGGNSEDYTRYGANFSRDFTVFNRPLYFSIAHSGSIRDPLSERDNEIQNGLNFNGRYQFAEPDFVSFGYNFLTTDSAGNIDDYRTYTSFVEYTHKFLDRRDTELVLRGEYNDYDYETNSEDYQENRYLVTLVTHF
ncbi:MAG: hypothetical protein EOM26_11225 [Alphaproteobacteria bacterium]|nr:hypothetical protein [Alphaproteobacteria bacterium]